ncbi:MAG: hypothetical protein H6713_06860 [Myxococcales bacterium]|nr:hypothetical protein [Myxococcales bacterium]MCB9749713.1 hypothetical protein [Myxococcales bacterium]
MMSPRRTTPTVLASFALALTCSLALGGCKKSDGYQGNPKSDAYKWIESPSSGAKEGNFIKVPGLKLSFEIPETRYVFKNCFEPTHSAESPTGWTPIVRCTSSADESVNEEDVDQGASETDFSEEISLTFYIAKKERPIDERAVAYFRNSYKEEGYEVRELSFNDDYHDKRGIYTELLAPAEEGGSETEIVQFMFTRAESQDVVFVARMEYPFGDTRSVTADWKSMMWYFRFDMDKDK